MWFIRFLFPNIFKDVHELQTKNYFFTLSNADFLLRIQRLEKRIEVLNDRIDCLENTLYSIDEFK